MRTPVKLTIGLLGVALLVLFAMQSSALMDKFGWHGLRQIETLRLGAFEGDVGALEWIARDHGFFERAGLNVEITGMTSGREATDALRAGTVDVATASDFVTVSRSFDDPDLRILGSVSYYRNKAIVARRSSGIAAPVDLKGKRIGVTLPSSAEYSLYVFLALNGLSLQDVTLVNLLPKQIVDAIDRKEIDAAITWEPHVQTIQTRLSDDGHTFQGEGFDAYLLLLASRNTVETQSNALKKMLRALIAAEEWARANPDEARLYLAKRFNLPADYVASLWPRMQLDVTLPQELLAVMDGQARWLAGKKEDTRVIPNYFGLIRMNELKAVKSSAVTLYTDVRPPSAQNGKP